MSIAEGRHEQGIDRWHQNILLPKQTVEEHRQGGVKTCRDQKLYPGYIFIQMKLFNADGAMISDNWHFVNQTPGVIGFIGGDAPVPIPAEEIEEIQAQISGEGEKPRPKILFNPGDLIIFRNGPFENCEGIVESVDDDHSRLKASVSMFGRSTIVEAEFGGRTSPQRRRELKLRNAVVLSSLFYAASRPGGFC